MSSHQARQKKDVKVANITPDVLEELLEKLKNKPMLYEYLKVRCKFYI